MKTLIIALMLSSSVVLADEVKSCPVGAKGSDCEIVKVYTRCDVDKQKLRNQIAALQRKLKQLEAQPAVVPAPLIQEKLIEKQVVIEKEVRVEAPKNNLSLLGGRSMTGLETTSTYPNFNTQTTGEFDVGLMYQRALGKNWKASIIGTKNGNFYGGIGYDF